MSSIFHNYVAADTVKPSSCELCEPLYLYIIPIFISKSIAVHLEDYLIFLSSAHLPAAIEQFMNIFLTSENMQYNVSQDMFT
jgi:hypothetical protein